MKKSVTIRIDAERLEQLEVIALVNGRTISEEMRTRLDEVIDAARRDPSLSQKVQRLVVGERERIGRITRVAEALARPSTVAAADPASRGAEGW